LHSHQQHIRVPVSPHLCQRLLLLSLLIMTIPTGVRWNLSVVLICKSYNQGRWALLHVFASHLYLSSFENSLFNSCAHFFTGVLILWRLSFFEFPVDSGYYSLIRQVAGTDFLPFCGLSLESGDCFLWCVETL
jgi:hypothetical protein